MSKQRHIWRSKTHRGKGRHQRCQMSHVIAFMWSSRKAKGSSRDRSQDCGVLWGGEGGRQQGLTSQGHGRVSRVGGMFYILTAMWFPCMYASVKTPWNCALKICEFSENCNSLKTNFLKKQDFPLLRLFASTLYPFKLFTWLWGSLFLFPHPPSVCLQRVCPYSSSFPFTSSHAHIHLKHTHWQDTIQPTS